MQILIKMQNFKCSIKIEIDQRKALSYNLKLKANTGLFIFNQNKHQINNY